VLKSDIRRVLISLGAVAAVELGTEAGEVPLPHLGKLKAGRSAARTGRNPATGATLEIAAKNTVKFAAAKALKDMLA
jgi:DNA-binding protein HU-beta